MERTKWVAGVVVPLLIGRIGAVEFVTSTDPARLDREWIWRMLSTEAYWHRWRNRDDVDRAIDGAWRVVGLYEASTGQQVGFGRAVSDGVNDAYLADVIVDPQA